MGNEKMHMKICCVIRNKQIKTMIRYPYKPIRIAKILKILKL